MKSGYTLIELAVVILILGIVLMVAAPRLTPFLTETKLDTSARQLATFCRYANAQAVLTKTYLSLHIDIDAGEYWLTAFGAADGPGFLLGNQDMEEIEVTTDLLRRRRLPDTVTFQDVDLSDSGYADRGTVVTEFTPVGATQEMLVHLRGKSGSQLTVFFDPVTGTHGILEGYAESVTLQGLVSH
jgi:prepilin-type N-terminal cleavage/methylation domain-containing protein